VTSHCSTYLSALSLPEIHSLIPTHTSGIPSAAATASATVVTTAGAGTVAEGAAVNDSLAVKDGLTVKRSLDCHLTATTAALTNASYPDSDTNRRGVIRPDPDGGGEREAVTLKNVFDLQTLILVRRDSVAPQTQNSTPSCCPIFSNSHSA
jgi:hypothetical protein